MAVIQSGSGGNLAAVDNNNKLQVALADDQTQAGYALIVSENDAGVITGTPATASPETDNDYRLRTANEIPVDDETFNYTAQNTGKHNNLSTTMTYSYTTGGVISNGSSITTTTTGISQATYAMFPMFANGESTYYQGDWSFSASSVPANTILDFGMFLRPAANPYAPTDGFYFRFNSSGLFGVINHNTSESTTSAFTGFTPTPNRVYKFLIAANNNSTEFWIDDVLYGTIATPNGQGQPCMSAALPMAWRHVITGGAAGGVFQATQRGYSVSLGGLSYIRNLGESGNSMFGSYQGLSGGTMGSLATYVNNTNPTAAVPSNTALTANLPPGLGGQAWETATLALNTDGIICSYQVPAGTVSVPGKRLKISGVKLSSFIQTVIAGGPFVRTFTLNFGHTAVSLVTAEAATTKARRVVLLPELTQVVTAAQAVSTLVSQPYGSVSLFPSPIYVNPGEFVSIAVKHIGTVGTSGTIATNIQYIYEWE
jgi:hypothetical protein